MRPVLLRTMNVPKDDNFTVSPVISVSVMISRTDLTRSADSVLDRPTLRCTASLKSARVSVLPAMCFPCMPNSKGKMDAGPGQQKSSCELNSLQSRVKVLPADEHRSPGEAAAHRLHQHQVAALDSAIPDRRVERQGNGR